MEALLAVDGGVDLNGRKNEPIFRREILYPLHFTELEECGSLFHCRFVLGLAFSLEGFQQGEVLLDGPVDALLVEREELEVLRLYGEDTRGGEGGVDLFVFGAELALVCEKTDSEEIVLDGAGAIQTPTVGCYALSELGFHRSFGGEVFHQSFRQGVVSGAVFFGHGGDLAGETVTERVHAGALAPRLRLRSRRLLSVTAVRGDLFVSGHTYVHLSI